MNFLEMQDGGSGRRPLPGRVSYDAYRLCERTAVVRSEYCQGRVYPKATGTFAHAVLSANVIALMGTQSRHSEKSVMDGSIRLRIEATGLDTYPDAVVVCGHRQLLDEGGD